MEDRGVEGLLAKTAIERLDVAVLPGTAWLDEERLYVELGEPLANQARRERRAVVRPQGLGRP